MMGCSDVLSSHVAEAARKHEVEGDLTENIAVSQALRIHIR